MLIYRCAAVLLFIDAEHTIRVYGLKLCISLYAASRYMFARCVPLEIQ